MAGFAAFDGDRKTFQLCILRRLPAVEKPTGPVIPQIGGPGPHGPGGCGHPPDEAQWIGDRFQQRSEQLRRIPEAFPIALAAGIVRCRQVGRVGGNFPQPAMVLVSPVAARIGVAVSGIDEEEVDPPAAAIRGGFRVAAVLADQRLDGAQGRENANFIAKPGDRGGQRPKHGMLFGRREADDIRDRGRGVDRTEALFGFRQVDAHGVAGVGHGEPQVDGTLIEPLEGLAVTKIDGIQVGVLRHTGGRLEVPGQGPAHIAVDAQVDRRIDAGPVKNGQGLGDAGHHAGKAAHVFVHGIIGRIQADPEVSQPRTGQALGQPGYAIFESGLLGVAENETVGSGADEGNAGITGMADQRKQTPGVQERLSAGKRDRLDALPGGGVDQLADHFRVQGRPRKGRRGAHAALGTAGVASIGDLDHQLAGNPIAHDGADEACHRYLAVLSVDFSVLVKACLLPPFCLLRVSAAFDFDVPRDRFDLL